MNILILTPINPIVILEAAQKLNKEYEGDERVIPFSIQEAALAVEQSKEYNQSNMDYVNLNLSMLNNALNREVDLSFNKPHTIWFGNLYKGTKKFDHIITCDKFWYLTSTDEELKYEDEYIALMKEKLSQETIRKLGIDKFYTRKDCEHSFSTYHHLFLFIGTLLNGIQ